MRTRVEMSDALSDIARDQKREAYFGKFLDKVKEYVKNPNLGNLDAAAKMAEETDNVPRGYWGGGSNLREGMETLLTQLVSKDKLIQEAAWARLLGMAVNRSQFRELKTLSPFSGKMILFVDYGRGFANIDGLKLLESFISKAIENQGMKTYDSDDYLVVMPPLNIDPNEIKAYWLSCGTLGVKGPRPPK